jgi:hypothetical protein
MTAIIGWVRQPPGSVRLLFLCALILAALALAVDLTAVWLDLYTVQFTDLRRGT